MKATFIKDKRNDLQTVNAARVSFKKTSDVFTFRNDVKNSDEGLVSYLYGHTHWTPFTHSREMFSSPEKLFDLDNLSVEERTGLVMKKIEGVWYTKHSLWGWCSLLKRNALGDNNGFVYESLTKYYPNIMKIVGVVEKAVFSTKIQHLEPNSILDPDLLDYTLHEKVPIFVARQRFKHMVGNTYNEVSRRYVDDDPEFFQPVWRERPEASIKQGSGLEFPENVQSVLNKLYDDVITHCEEVYKILLAYDVAPEQARVVLPQSMYTEYYVTGNLSAWRRAFRQRIDGHAQKEIQQLAEQWDEIFKQECPIWEKAKND